MKIIFIDTPYQKPTAEHPGWCVTDALLRLNQTFQEWISEMEEKIEAKGKSEEIVGLYIYDMQPVVAMTGEPGMIVRYAYILK